MKRNTELDVLPSKCYMSWHKSERASSPQTDVVDVVPNLRRLLPELERSTLDNRLHSLVSVVNQNVQAAVLLVFNPLEQLVDLLVVLMINLNRNAFAATVSYLESSTGVLSSRLLASKANVSTQTSAAVSSKEPSPFVDLRVRPVM